MKVLFVVHQLEYAGCSAIGYLSAIAKQMNHSTVFFVHLMGIIWLTWLTKSDQKLLDTR